MTTYEHKLLETHRTGKHPVFIGPIMVHLHGDAESYEYFASTLGRLCPELAGIHVVRTDGEEALKEGFRTVFPGAVQIQCAFDSIWVYSNLAQIDKLHQTLDDSSAECYQNIPCSSFLHLTGEHGLEY